MNTQKTQTDNMNQIMLNHNKKKTKLNNVFACVKTKIIVKCSY